MQPLISILIPTQGRLPQLGRLLDGLARMEDRERIPHEIIIANNARDENTTKAVKELVGTYIAREPDLWYHVRESVPGKSRALNGIIPLAKGNILGL